MGTPCAGTGTAAGRRTGGGLTIDRRGLLAALAASAAAPAWGKAASGGAGRYAATQALIDGYVAQGLVPGAVVGILHPGRFAPTWLTAGRTLFEGGEPVSPTGTLWRLFSMTKPVTGIAVMQQVGAGKLSIDTPIADIMPEFRQMRVLVDPEKGLESRPAEKPILLRHILTHTAGFTYTIAGNGPLEREYRRMGMLPMSSGSLLQPGDTPAPDLATYMQRLATLPLHYEPGTKWRYSISLDVAGALLERLTGKTLDRVFADQLFGPLGMDDTAFWLDAPRQKRLAGLYAWVDPKTMQPAAKPTLADGPAKTEWAERPVMLAGGAGLVGSAENYARFAQMMLNEGMFNGKVLLPRTTARLAMSNLMERGVTFYKGDGNGAGGRAILTDSARIDPGSYRVGTWGWGGAASTLFHVDPVRGHAVVLMLQSFGNPKGPNEQLFNKALAADSDG
jgi:CubicO group peptidase (beta-lactamase class C family)